MQTQAITQRATHWVTCHLSIKCPRSIADSPGACLLAVRVSGADILGTGSRRIGSGSRTDHAVPRRKVTHGRMMVCGHPLWMFAKGQPRKPTTWSPQSLMLTRTWETSRSVSSCFLGRTLKFAPMFGSRHVWTMEDLVITLRQLCNKDPTTTNVVASCDT